MTLEATPQILGREDLSRWNLTPLKLARSWFTPDVILLEQNGVKLVLKDVRRRPWLFRLLWCRKAIAREVTAMRRLQGLTIAPRLVAHLDADGFVMEWLDAKPLPARRLAEELGTGFFRELELALREMHARGVAHGDVRRRNILVTPDRHPRIIDFETAILDGPSPLRRRFFRFTSNVDDLTVLKIFGSYFPHALDESARTRLAQAPLGLRIGRFLRKRVYHPISPKVMGPRLRRWRAALFGNGER